MPDKARKYITELFKIVDTRSILVITYTGRIKRIYCPFIVVCNINAPPLQKGLEYSVDAVKMTLKKKDVFIIDQRGYYISYFSIKV